MIKVNGVEVKFEKFPNGETKLIEGSFKRDNVINQVKFKYEDDSDLIKLMFVKNYLDAVRTVSELTVFCMPYCRMDRSENGSAFTLKYVSNFINGLGFDKVNVIEPHSDVTCALLDRSEAISVNEWLLNKVVEDIGFNSETDY